MSYQQLSLRIGLFCGRADAFLGRDHFGSRMRGAAWDLTQALFDELAAEARALGIPESVTAVTPDDAANEQRIIEAGTQAQRQVDRRWVH